MLAKVREVGFFTGLAANSNLGGLNNTAKLCEERALRLLNNRVKLLSNLSPQEIVNIGPDGIKRQTNLALEELRAFWASYDSSWVKSVPKDYDELAFRLQPAKFSDLTDDFYDSDPFTSGEGFVGYKEDPSQVIFDDALTLLSLEISYDEFLQKLAEYPSGFGCGPPFHQLSPFADGTCGKHDVYTRYSTKESLFYSRYGEHDYGWRQVLPIINIREYIDISYAELLPYFIHFWRFFEGRGTEYRFHPERAVWKLEMLTPEKNFEAFMLDLRKRRDDILKAKSILEEAIDEGKYKNHKYGYIVEPFYGVVSSILKDPLVYQLIGAYGNFEVLNRTHKIRRENQSRIFYSSSDGWGINETLKFLEYFEEADRVLSQRISETPIEEQKIISGLFRPTIVADGEPSFFRIPRDKDRPIETRKISNDGFADRNYVEPRKHVGGLCPIDRKLLNSMVRAVYGGERSGILFNFPTYPEFDKNHASSCDHYHNPTYPFEMARIDLANASVRLLEKGFDPSFRISFFSKTDKMFGENVPKTLGELAALIR